MHSVKAGVPQGSVLGPVHFLLFVNNLPLFISEAYVDLYADDSTVHSSNTQLNTVQDDLQMGSDSFKDWCLKPDLRIHLKKTSVMTVGFRQALTKIDSLNILLDNELIKSVDNRKRLGIDAVCLNVNCCQSGS